MISLLTKTVCVIAKAAALLFGAYVIVWAFYVMGAF